MQQVQLINQGRETVCLKMSAPGLALLGATRSEGYTAQNVPRTNRKGNPKKGKRGWEDQYGH